MVRWTMSIATSALALALVGPQATAQTPPPAPPPAATAITYESYCARPTLEKRDLWRTLTPEQRTMLAVTQLERFRHANRSRLKAEQITLLDTWIGLAPLEFVRPRLPDLDAKLGPVAKQLEASFSKEDQEAMDQYGPCYPKPVK
jgi:hypothetical protein